MQIVPIQAAKSQSFAVLLANQNCRIDIYQKSTGLFLNLYVGGSLIIGGVICLNLVRIVRSLYLGFVGDLAFYDTQSGTADPIYTDLGTRFVLLYIEASELPVGVG